MWFVWVMWGIVTISIIATIILMTGKGSKFVTGFNTKSTEERAQYDSKKVSKQAGIFMILIDVGLIACLETFTFSPNFFCVSPSFSRNSFTRFFKITPPFQCQVSLTLSLYHIDFKCQASMTHIEEGGIIELLFYNLPVTILM